MGNSVIRKIAKDNFPVRLLKYRVGYDSNAGPAA